MLKKIMLVSLLTLCISFIIVWNSSLVSEYRAYRKLVNNRTSAHEENSYDNHKLLDMIEIDDIEFYIFEVDEFHSGNFNSRVYSVVRSDKRFLGFRTYEQVSFSYDGMYGTSLAEGGKNFGTLILGVKEINDFNKMKLTLDDGEVMIVDVTSTKYTFFFSEERLNVESYEEYRD